MLSEIPPPNSNRIPDGTTRSAIHKIVCLQSGRPFPEGGGSVTIDADMISAMTDVYNRIIDKSYALVDQHWRAILRVAKHLERHGEIKDQATLDDLIGCVEQKDRRESAAV
jgi:hypothetical protein